MELILTLFATVSAAFLYSFFSERKAQKAIRIKYARIKYQALTPDQEKREEKKSKSLLQFNRYHN